jgi:hypothetical protein
VSCHIELTNRDKTAVQLFRRDHRSDTLPRRSGGRLALPVIGLSLSAGLLLALVGYVLWPDWPSSGAADAPSLPIVVAGETFNIPPAAIRTPVQRHAGRQERLDLAFQWPSLSPPDPAARLIGDRLFVTIAVAASLPPSERLTVIYPRYTAGEPVHRPDGLTEYGFRDGTPYQGEDLVVDAATPQRFSARCSRRTGPRTPGICLHDRRIGDVDLSVRFPRDWLDQWRGVADGIDRLVERLTHSRSR